MAQFRDCHGVFRDCIGVNVSILRRVKLLQRVSSWVLLASSMTTEQYPLEIIEKPLQLDFEPRYQPRESLSSTLSDRFRTLIVDDNPVNLNILERILKRHFSHFLSPDIVMASSGNAALCQLNRQTISAREKKPSPFISNKEPEKAFDLILLDIDMPGGISGVQVAEQIRKVHNDQTTAIVAVTTSTKPEQLRTYEMVGMDGVVGKPIDLNQLGRVVTRALLSRRAGGHARTSSVPRGFVTRVVEEQGI